MKNQDLTIISVTYNSKEIISQFLKDIYQKFEIIIVDNASKDGTADFVRDNFPEVKIIKSEKNLGYGRGANLGLQSLSTDYAFLLNPDIISDEAAIINLLEVAKNTKNLGVLAPATDENEYIKSENFIAEKTNWVVGATMLFKMENLKKIGFFDENIFLYYEETDLCKRIEKAGFEILICKNILLKHLVGKSSTPNPKIEYLKYWHSSWSKFYFYKKHLSLQNFRKKSLSLSFSYLLKYLLYIISFNKLKAIKYKARLAGGINFLLGAKAFDEAGNPRGLNSNN
ncbi:MAG: glycosyltransferase family 2 protein [Rickettsiales bacterium]|nr:glycosyltransferase family 2 protein [Rickettsiales bacterium]